jgi:alkaline phosphatase
MWRLLAVILLACRPDVVEPVESGTKESGLVDTDSGQVIEPPGPRAVILFIGDGMGFEHVQGGGLYRNGEAGSLEMESMPWSGRLRTASLSGYTDSAASATAMATGVKTFNAYLGMDRTGAEVPSLFDQARGLGLATGVVTTDQLTGATPSAFQANVLSRYDTTAIVSEWLVDVPDVAFGGGAVNLLKGMTLLDIQLLTSSAELAEVEPDGRPIVGLFADTTFPFVLDTILAGGDTDLVEDVPTLAEMVDAAIQLLSTHEEGFFLVVESARIDHASHSNSASKVHPETVAFDDAVAVAKEWAEARNEDFPELETTLLVTADHECGGMVVTGTSAAGEIPTTEWRWGDHTNADVPVFGFGERAAVLDGERFDNTWVHAVLSAAVAQQELVEPDVPRLVDGWTEDLGPVVAQQLHDTSFGAGFNQLDALHLTADSDGLWMGVDGVFEWGDNAVVVLIDLDYPNGTGLLADTDLVLSDTDGALDALLSALDLSTQIDGLGFDIAVSAIGAREVRDSQLQDDAGLRGLHGVWGEVDELWWLSSITNFDDGNLAKGGPAADAGSTGSSEGGFEALVPWSTLYGDSLPSEPWTVAVSAILVNTNGENASNQALPSYASGAEPGVQTIEIFEVATVTVDATGTAID